MTIAAAYWPQTWAMAAIPFLRNARVFSKIVSTDFKDEPGYKGKVVNTRVRKPFTVSDKDDDTDYNVQTIDAREVPISLDYYKEVSFRVPHLSSTFSFKELTKEFGSLAIEALADNVDLNVINKAYATDIPVVAYPVAGATYDEDDMIADRTWQNTQKAPPGGRYIILGNRSEGHAISAARDHLGKDVVGEDGNRLKEATLGHYLGNTFLRGDSIATVTAVDSPSPAVPEYERNLVLHKSAIQIVTRPLEEAPEGLGVRSALVNIDGLAIRVLVTWNHAKGGVVVTFEHLYGILVTNFAFTASPAHYLVGEHRSATAALAA